jgi:hypothetical protein
MKCGIYEMWKMKCGKRNVGNEMWKMKCGK